MIAQVLCALALIHNSVARSDFIWSDGFESGLGKWGQYLVNAPHTFSDYVRVNNGSTGSKGTGPAHAYEGHNYIYYEDSIGDEAVSLGSPWFTAPKSKNCTLSYAIHMNGSSIESLEVKLVDQRLVAYGYRYFIGSIGPYWFPISVSVDTSDAHGNLKALLMFNGSSGYQGDVALDALKLICLDGNPGPFTNGTAAPHPTGNGEVRVKFGGAKVNVNVPGFTAVEDLDVAAEGVFYMFHNVIMAPFYLIHYLIHGY